MDGLSPDEVPLSAGFVYWQFCMLNVLLFTKNSKRKIFIAYDQLIQKPQEESRVSVFFWMNSVASHLRVLVSELN